MTERDFTDDLVLLRQELSDLGVRPPAGPDASLLFRPAESFFVQPPAPSRRRRRAPLVVGGLLAAALVAAVLVLPRLPQEPAPQPAEFVTAAQVFRAAGEAVPAASGSAVVSARFWYVESIVRQGSRAPDRQRKWLGHFGPGALSEGGRLVQMDRATFGLARTTLSWDGVAALPVTSAELRRLLEAEAGQGADAEWLMFKMAGELLVQAPTTAAQRVALWSVLASLDATTLRGRAEDGAGRAGQAVEITTLGRGSLTYVVDPESGALLQMRLEPEKGSGRDSYSVTYLVQGPVDSTASSPSSTFGGPAT